MTLAAVTFINRTLEQLWESSLSRNGVHLDEVKPEPSVAHAWAHAFHPLREYTPGTGEKHEVDQERIACLEAIVTVLVEKNERIRRQLLESRRRTSERREGN